MEEVWEQLCTTLLESSERMQKHYDKSRKLQPDFKVGDKVLLNAKNIKTMRPSKKLDHQMRGPWTIIRRVGP